jgi:hypothetical protein
MYNKRGAETCLHCASALTLSCVCALIYHVCVPNLSCVCALIYHVYASGNSYVFIFYYSLRAYSIMCVGLWQADVHPFFKAPFDGSQWKKGVSGAYT